MGWLDEFDSADCGVTATQSQQLLHTLQPIFCSLQLHTSMDRVQQAEDSEIQMFEVDAWPSVSSGF